MQIHLHGFHHGEPDIAWEAPSKKEPQDGVYDVLVIGSGAAGSVLAAQLSQVPEISTRFIEKRETPMTLGQADGVNVRTVEMFNAFELAHKLLREAYTITETTFWGHREGSDGIVRTGRTPDTETGLSEFPHVIVNQARLQQYLVDKAANSPTRLACEYGLEVLRVTPPATPGEPVEVTVRATADPEGPEQIIKARYVVGCDGARSNVRRSLGLELKGDSMHHAYGVLDVLGVTNFPDIRHKSIIRTPQGGIGLIPREGGYLTRLYVDLGRIEPGDQTFREIWDRDAIIAKAQEYFAPYTFEPREVPWWSLYEVAQRLTDRMDDVPDEERGTRTPQIFLAGDASHTHSAKAGQGMNVSMADGFNLGWKLISVLTGRSPESLLDTYNEERRPVAKELIDFDRYFAAAMGGEHPDVQNPDGSQNVEKVQQVFLQASRYTAGVATHYPVDSSLTGPDDHQKLAEGYPLGYRFHSAPVIRLADAKPVQLGHVHKADGRWRLYAFADTEHPTSAASKLAALGTWLATDPQSPVLRYTPEGADIDSVFDAVAIFQQGFQEFDIEQVPSIFFPAKGRLGLKDYEKVFTPDYAAEQDVYALRQVDRGGALVVVRPDQYVAHVLPLDAYDELAAFFARGMAPVR